MTVHEMYDQTIRTLSEPDRLCLARLILNDISPSNNPVTIRDKAHIEELLLAGVNAGPGAEATPEYWRRLEAELLGGRD